VTIWTLIRAMCSTGSRIALLPLLGVVAATFAPSVRATEPPPGPWQTDAGPPPPDTDITSGHPEPLGHKHLAPEQRLLPRSDLGGLSGPSVRPSPGPLMAATSKPIVSREVLGYLPYWSYTATSPYVPLRWDLITTLAWFAVAMDDNGNISDRNGWGGAQTAAIVREAHAHGVKVVVTVTNFSGTGIANIVNSAQRRQTAITNCLALMRDHDADGIDIDFEFVPKAARDGFVTFMTDLKTAVRAARPNGHEGHVTLAGPAIDWSGAYDYDVLLANTDGIMVMAYGYHWTKSNPGPTAPLFSGDLWSSRSISWTVDDYLRYGGVENRHKIIIGLPWYGRSWKVATQAIPGTALSDGATRTFKVAEPVALALGKGWEDVSKSTYYHQTVSGSLNQVWYDDGRAFREKVAYVDERDLGGIGIWALGYEGDYPDLWDAIASVLATSPAPDPELVEPSPEAVEPSPEAVEPGPETVEPSPEVVEPAPDIPDPEPIGPDASEPPADLDHSGAPSATALRPTRTLRASEVQNGGCQGGSSPPWQLMILSLLLPLLRRRAQRG